MDAFAAGVFGVVIVLLFALHRKGDLRAGAKVGPASFFLEVHDKKRSSRKLPS